MKNNKNIGIIGAIILIIAIGILVNWEKVVSNTQRLTNTLPQLESNPVSGEDFLNPQSLIGSTQVGTISSAEKQGLIQMREEEKLAHDVYVVLGEYWKQQTFNNISKSEQTHTDAVKSLLEKYSITDPYADGVGKFTDKKMQELYESLVLQGKKSLVEALKVGALIEDLDIADLNSLLVNTSNDDIKIVYSNLLRGSKNHLRSFARVLKNVGGTYTPAYISKELYEEIISSTSDTGRTSSRSNGRGRGAR